MSAVGVAKSRVPLLSLAMLGMLAGAFIGLGALFMVIVHSDATLGFAAMMLQAAAGEPVALAGLWRNLVPVIAGNLVGGSVLVALVYYVIYVRPRKGEGA